MIDLSVSTVEGLFFDCIKSRSIDIALAPRVRANVSRGASFFYDLGLEYSRSEG